MLVTTFTLITCLVRQEDCCKFEVSLDKEWDQVLKTKKTKESLAGKFWSRKKEAFWRTWLMLKFIIYVNIYTDKHTHKGFLSADIGCKIFFLFI